MENINKEVEQKRGRGRPRVENKKNVKLVVFMRRDLFEKLQKASEEEDRTMSAVCERALKIYLN